MLEVKDLKVAYGRVMAVKGISFKVDQGQVVTLLGTNGAGKTTTLRTISGLIRPESGEIWFEGDRIDTTPAHQVLMRGLAHSPEGRRIFPRLTVEENLMLGAFARKDRSWYLAGPGAGLQSLRHLAGKTLPTGRHVLGRGAADAGDWSSDDEPPEALDDGRAIDGSLAAHDAAHHVNDRRTAVRRCHDPARRAERPGGALARQLRICPGSRQDRAARTPARRCWSMTTSARSISARTENGLVVRCLALRTSVQGSRQMIGEAGAPPRDNVVRNRFRCCSPACCRSGGSQRLGRRDRDRRGSGGSGQPSHQQGI